MFLTCIQGVPGSKLGWDTNYPDEVFSCLSSVLADKCQDYLKLGHGHFFPHAFKFIILPMNFIQSVILTSLNGSQNTTLKYLNLQSALCDSLRNGLSSNHLNSLQSLQMTKSTSSANKRWQGTSKKFGLIALQWHWSNSCSLFKVKVCWLNK